MCERERGKRERRRVNIVTWLGITGWTCCFVVNCRLPTLYEVLSLVSLAGSVMSHDYSTCIIDFELWE